MAVGPDEMVDLDSIEARLDEQPAQGAAGGNLLRASAASGLRRGKRYDASGDAGEQKRLVSERLTFLPRTR